MTARMEFPLTLQSAPWPQRKFGASNDVDELALRVLMRAAVLPRPHLPAVERPEVQQPTRAPNTPPKTPGTGASKTAKRKARAREEAS